MKFILSLLLFCSSSLFAKESDPLIYLTWCSDPTTTMTIRWITEDLKASSTLQYRQKNGSWLSVQGSKRNLPERISSVVYSVELKKLESNSLYEFRLASQMKSNFFRTLPTTLNKKSLRFIVGGDLYHSSMRRFRTMTQAAAKTNPHFAILGGDLAYSVSAGDEGRENEENYSRWKEFFRCWMKEMKDDSGCMIPILAAIGNHEVKGGFRATPKEAELFYSFFDKGYYDISLGRYLHLIFLDSDHTHRIKGEQTTWLEKRLKAHKRALHRFVTYHVGAYPSTSADDSRPSRNIRKYWVPLFEKYQTHACFESHDHAYKRTFALIDGKEDPRGVIYFGDGSWGVHPRIPKKRKYIAFAAAKQQVLLVKLTEHTRSFKAIDSNGEIIDSIEQPV